MWLRASAKPPVVLSESCEGVSRTSRRPASRQLGARADGVERAIWSPPALPRPHPHRCDLNSRCLCPCGCRRTGLGGEHCGLAGGTWALRSHSWATRPRALLLHMAGGTGRPGALGQAAWSRWHVPAPQRIACTQCTLRVTTDGPLTASACHTAAVLLVLSLEAERTLRPFRKDAIPLGKRCPHLCSPRGDTH